MQRADPHFFVRTQIVIQIKRSEFCPDHGVLAWRVVQVSLGHCIAVCLISGFRMACWLRCVPRRLRYVFAAPCGAFVSMCGCRFLSVLSRLARRSTLSARRLVSARLALGWDESHDTRSVRPVRHVPVPPGLQGRDDRFQRPAFVVSRYSTRGGTSG